MRTRIRNWLGERGWWITPAGIVLTVAYGWWLYVTVRPKWETIPGLQLSELGNFLAGAFGPPAFLWLILGYILQRLELRENREALLQQAAEQRRLVEVTQEQIQLEKNALEEEREKVRRAAAPKFTFDIALGSPIMPGSKLSMKNTGGTVTDLVLSFSEPFLGLEECRLPVLEQGTTTNFIINDTHVLDENEADLVVSFVNSLGQSQSLKYRLSCRKAEGVLKVVPRGRRRERK